MLSLELLIQYWTALCLLSSLPALVGFPRIFGPKRAWILVGPRSVWDFWKNLKPTRAKPNDLFLGLLQGNPPLSPWMSPDWGPLLPAHFGFRGALLHGGDGHSDPSFQKLLRPFFG